MAFIVKKEFLGRYCYSWIEIPGKIFASTENGQIHMSTDNGATFSVVHSVGFQGIIKFFILNGDLFAVRYGGSNYNFKIIYYTGVTWVHVANLAANSGYILDVIVQGNYAYLAFEVAASGVPNIKRWIYRYDGSKQLVGMSGGVPIYTLPPGALTVLYEAAYNNLQDYLSAMAVDSAGRVYFVLNDINFGAAVGTIKKWEAGVITDVLNVTGNRNIIGLLLDGSKLIYIRTSTPTFPTASLYEYDLGTSTETSLGVLPAGDYEFGRKTSNQIEKYKGVYFFGYPSSSNEEIIYFYYDGEDIIEFDRYTNSEYPFTAQQGFLEIVGSQLLVGTFDRFLSVDYAEPTPPEKGFFFEFAQIQSLRYVKEATVNNCEVFQTMDNTLFCKQVYPYFSKVNYYQKVAQCDSFPNQFKSDWLQHEVKLLKYQDGTEVKTFTVEQKLQLTNLEEQAEIFITNNGSGQSRVYFYSGSLPVPFEVGQIIEIINNADGFNGEYAIVSIQNDIALGAQYLVISKNYGIVASSTSGQAIYVSSPLPFNVFEFITSYGDVPAGVYYIRARAFSASFEDVIVSEPIQIAASHPNTNIIEFRGFDNCFDVVYRTGFTSKIRVESLLFAPIPSGERDTIRGTTGKLSKLKAQYFRKFRFEFKQLPPYLIEKLSVIFDHDFIKVNGVEVQTEEGMEEPKFPTRYPLGNTQIIIEQVELFKTYNTDDLGSIDDEQGFIIANEGYLKR